MSKISETLPLIETVLFGHGHHLYHTGSKYDAQCVARGLPTPQELRESYNLERAKALCATLPPATEQAVVPRAAHGGRFLVIDFLSTRASREAITLLEHAGLTGTTLLARDQLDGICGHLSAAWACGARALGDDFASFSMEAAEAFNTDEFAAEATTTLGMSEVGWLSGDQILELAAAHNPDGDGRDAAWLSGPGPFNMWRVHFLNTINTPAQHGRVHTWVVNSESQYSLHAPVGGQHWFLVVWIVEAEPTGDA